MNGFTQILTKFKNWQITSYPLIVSGAAPPYGQGGPRTTLTFKKKKLYIII